MRQSAHSVLGWWIILWLSQAHSLKLIWQRVSNGAFPALNNVERILLKKVKKVDYSEILVYLNVYYDE